MPVDESYKLYLEEKFKGLQVAQHGYFREVHDRFDAIDKSNEIRLMDGVSKVQRNGYVKINDNGLTDSIKVR